MGRKTPYKFFRGNGSTFKKNHEKASKYFYEIQRMLQENEHLKFERLNYFSKSIYLWYLNENKAYEINQPIENYCVNAAIFSMFKRNLDKIYKPLAELLKEECNA